MNNVEDESGVKDSRIKLIRDESIGSYSWYTTTSVNARLGVNEWSQAHLMKLMNPGYESESVGGSLYWNRTSGSCYNNHSGGRISCNFTEIGIKSKTQKMIEKVNWHTGSNGNAKSFNQILTKEFYELERSENTGKICSGGINCNDNIIRTTNWIGYVGLIYPSDYGFASKGGETANRETCLNTILYDWNNVSDCYQNNWLNKQGYDAWTLTPAAEPTYANHIFFISSSAGNIRTRYASLADNTSSTYPVIYLKQDMQITNGNGTKENPYVIVE